MAFGAELAKLDARNALELVEKACGDCPTGRALYRRFRFTVLRACVRDLVIREHPHRSPLDEMVRVFAHEFFFVLSHVQRVNGQWRASGPALYRGRQHADLVGAELVTHLERVAERAAALEAEQQSKPKHKPRKHWRSNASNSYSAGAMSAQLQRSPRTLYDHFELLELGGVLRTWVPPRSARDAVKTKNGVYAQYALPADLGVIPRALLGRWRAVAADDAPLAAAEDAPPVRSELEADLAALIAADTS